MKKIKSSFTNMVVVLMLVALITGGLLAFVNQMTEKSIKMQAEKALAEGIQKVMGGKDVVVTKTETVSLKADNGKKTSCVVHHLSDTKGQLLGAAVESMTLGFSGDLKILVGFDTKGDILGYTILETSETPGLGAKADVWFQEGSKGSIIGKNPARDKLGVKKGGEGDVDAITASTITSRAFLKAVNQAYAAYRQKVSGSKN